ncbi:MAG: hypothetical protein HY617_00875 [Candidatus Sungbacteria bacterium]|nr:hypothetical protein [Candidatus Sungbacteria bacterium]
MNDKLSTIEKIGGWISTLLLGTTKEIIVRTDEKVSHLAKSMDEVKKCIDDFRTSIATHGANITALQVHTKYGVSHSPTVPNDKGKKLLEDSGFNSFYSQMKPQIFSLMDSLNLRTLYDFEQGAERVLEQLKDNPAMDLLKQHAVNTPDEPLELIFRIASWVIRDDYSAHKNPPA